MNQKIAPLALAALLVLGVVPSIGAAEETVYQEVSRHYEAIRLALLIDSTAEVAEHAASIRKEADALAENYDAARAGVTAEQSEESKALLAEIGAAARQVAEADSLDDVRTAFFELSKPLGRYRKLVGDLDSQVAFCPMAKKAWIQPQGEIGNPYLGAEMPDCGRIIAD